VIAGPIGGRLADRYNPRVIAAGGVVLTLVAVFFFSRLGLTTPALFLIVPLVLIGLGGGLFRPANQVSVYADVDRRDYGSLSAMLTSLGTLAGGLGTTITVAVTESRASSNDPVAFSEAIRFTFSALLPLLALAVVVSLAGRAPARQPGPAGRDGPAPVPAESAGR
jgi:MFS family permease